PRLRGDGGRPRADLPHRAMFRWRHRRHRDDLPDRRGLHRRHRERPMQLVVAAIIVAVLALTSGRAEAYPQFQLSRDQTCSGCHLSPAGGGLLSENGYSIAETMGKLTDSSAFIYGLAPMPKWLAVGGDLRSSTGFLHAPDNSPVFIPMQ